MAEHRDTWTAWAEAIGLPIAAVGIGIAAEVAFPGLETPIIPFLALVLVAIRHQHRLAWVAYVLAVTGYLLHSRFPIIHPTRPSEAAPDLLILVAAGALVIYGQMRTRRLARRATERERGEAERFRKLLTSSPDGIWQVNAEGITLHVNDAMAAMLGTTAEEMIGSHFAPWFTEEGLRTANAAFARAKQGEPVAVEIALRRKDGAEAWTLCSTHPVLNEQGVLVESFGILRDITVRHRAEQERQQALSLLEATLESTADGLLVVDAEGRITRFNERFASMWRIPPDILSSGDDQRALDFVVSQLADPEPFLSKVQKLYASPDSESFDTLRFKDGRVFERYSMPQRLDDQIVGRVWSFRDVTDRERAFEEQRLATEREASIARNLDAALFTCAIGPDGSVLRYDYFSKGAEALYGVSREVLETDTGFWLQRVHSEDLENVVRPAVERLVRLQPAVIEVRYQSSKGLHRWHRSHLFPHRDADGVIHVDGIEADVTERVKLEEQLRHAQKMEAIGQLAGGVAHDFNNILTAVIGYSDLLLTRLKEGDPNRRAVEEIRKGGERAAGLTRQLLAFGRRMTTQPRVVDPNAAVRDLEPMLRRLVGEDIVFELRLDPAVARVRIDPTQLEQVIVNLAVNARDAMPRGGELRIETANASFDPAPLSALPDGSYVSLSVSDTGQGIPDDVIEHIFEPFYTTKAMGQGTGLGLATVHGIVKQSGGDIVVRTAPGRGTTFTIYLPATDAPLPLDDSVVLADARTAVPGTVLLIEDDDAVREFAREVLKARGWRVIEAPGPADALMIASETEETFDVVVTDVVMPG
ncbi:MAG TPA: PAS domain S-box protein, partial [Candidatus Eisenbacteria bacterium]|nr:PAS domain S-box protein [Candidatus Eisenbacteria bacterium]